MSLATSGSSTNPTVVSRQEFDPWGSIRSGGIPQTTLNYTGQRRDATGLLYYQARYYDPVLARFISADSVVPGSPAGSMDGVALKPLTVDFHETGFVSGLNAEHGQGFWFQNTDQVAPWGPANPQGLNRYSYTQNNPIVYTDPDGHNRRPSMPACACGPGGGFKGTSGKRQSGILDGIAKLLKKVFGKDSSKGGNATSIPSLRAAYESEVRALAGKAADLRAKGLSSEQIARTLHAERRSLGVKYKEITPPEALEKIYARNLEKYGDELGPSIEWLRARGKSWEDIIESATRPGGQDIIPRLTK